jgi:thymidylate synthase (FAD)
VKVIAPSLEIFLRPEGGEVLRALEIYGRTCYKSEDRITRDSAEGFVRRLIKSGHHSVIEHAAATVRFVCDRGVTHELVRHRLAAYSQESTRYANYGQNKFGGQITVIRPLFWLPGTTAYELWLEAMAAAERAYLGLLAAGARPQEARAVLPHSLKTELVMTANLREWRHVLGLRCGRAAHPQIREIMLPLLSEFNRRLPAVFEDILRAHEADIAELACQERAWDEAASRV